MINSVVLVFAVQHSDSTILQLKNKFKKTQHILQFVNHVRVSPKEKRSINTLGNVWTLLLNTQVRQIQTVKLE